MQINYHHKHNIHPLSLLPRPRGFSCDICRGSVKVSYACIDCEFDVCAFCAFEQRLLHHQGQKEHTLILMKKKALFECDACHETAEDSSYVCTTCDFWIHKSCAFPPSIIQEPTYHHHPLALIYYIPNMYRYFHRFCGICSLQETSSQKLLGVFLPEVHIKCSTSTLSIVNEIEADDVDNEPDLVQFPLPSQESIFDLIVTQFGKLQVEIKGEGLNCITISTSANDPDIIENHWSHENHPLQQIQFTISENDDDDRRVLICNGCTQPITISQPSYYACIQCDFFLHSFCAAKLSHELPVGASPFHRNHTLLLQMDRFYNLVKCGLCDLGTNGFYYHCQTCDINIDIRCAFLPMRIKHKSHRHHSLVQRPSSDSGVDYACETCFSFHIPIKHVFSPRRMEHKYEIYPITLRNPPFFYERVFYCEICEEQFDNQYFLYHCSESDHSFHYECFNLLRNFKLGGTIDVKIGDKPHTWVSY